ncbi:rhodanese-like domain-containing protein [Planomicrobium sp. Y74]|uniref:rhodanese-like domain-containing protein n=1 Tax=Planomicrobium sp. Y74 TaxID=2478977 RepID=UPI000EF48A12|nr:rhodanese-like domain-containing protein [Planomicrobium sp. Y74]RLQ90257.1 rhodanese-like domain-containing protein [Planomicrobium sp. Y74]
MDTWVVILIGAVIVFIGYRTMSPAKGVKSISTDDLKSQLKSKDKQFIDVRTPGEYKANRIKEFKNIPLNELSGRVSELDKYKETYVICQSGMRSSKAASILNKNGFTNVINVRGGMGSYRS